MSKKIIVNEIFVIRAIACISVVLIHSLSSSLRHLDSSSIITSNTIDVAKLLLMFATPTFIFLSEFLLSISYPKTLPKNFFKIRIKALLIPYVLIGLIYSAININEFSFKAWFIESILNVVFTGYYGYFIIIIFQFYILHWLFAKYLSKLAPKKVIMYSFIINILYLSFFNVIIPSNNNFFFVSAWSKISYMPFVAWIFYFAAGYYAGKHYKEFVHGLHNNKVKVFLFSFLSLALLLYVQHLDLFEKTWSKRPDVLIYTTGILLLIFYYSSKVKKIPKIVYTISNYSFNIYLLHMIIITLIEKVDINFNFYIYLPTLFLTSIALSMLIAFTVNKFNFGYFIVGKTQKFKA